MPEPSPRKPRFQRTSPPPSIELTERDFLILQQVSVHRFLRSDHIVSLIDGSAQHLTRRLGCLYHAGLLDRPSHQRRLGEPNGYFTYCLSRRGRKELIERGEPVFASVPRLRKTGSALRLGHDLRVSDIVVALQSAAREVKMKFCHHHEWPGYQASSEKDALKTLQWKVRLHDQMPTWAIPDAAFSIHSNEVPASFFLLEVDRGTMPVTRTDPSQTSFVRKVECYKETRNAGDLWKRWQVPGFRILVITESEARRRSLQAGTAQCFRNGKSTMFLFGLAEEILGHANPLGAVWQNCSGESVSLLPKPPIDR